jgi:NADPH-dependent 2,4-dienoyl-CoA reductase/sulfur reductase-like enzyme
MSGHRPACLHNAATGRETWLPHRIERAARPGRRVVVVGGGPAGLEAARVSAERGHSVVLHEAADRPGGQVLIGAQGPWRQDLSGIVDWRVAELERLGVELRLSSFAEPGTVLADAPEVVIVATGGVPDLDWLEGADLCTTAWDLLTRQVPCGREVLVYDGTGRHPGPHAASLAAAEGSRVTLASPDGQLAAELAYAERVSWKDRLYRDRAATLFDHRLVRVRRTGNRLEAELVNEVTLEPRRIEADQVVVEHGTLPVTDVYDALRASSANDGVTDIDALLAMSPQPRRHRPDAAFELHRVGDAVTSRNIHAAVLDSLRLCCVL